MKLVGSGRAKLQGKALLEGADEGLDDVDALEAAVPLPPPPTGAPVDADDAEADVEVADLPPPPSAAYEPEPT